MNQNTKQEIPPLYNALVELSQKYGIEKGIFLCEQNKVSRVIVFISDKKEKFSVHAFADLYGKCLTVSKTLTDIVIHLGQHTMEKIFHTIEQDQQLHEGGKRVD